MHEPLVEIQGKNTNNGNEINVIKKNKISKKIAKKKTRIKKKSETKENHELKETSKIKYTKKNIKNDNKNDKKDNMVSVDEISETKKEESKADDKTGWWS